MMDTEKQRHGNKGVSKQKKLLTRRQAAEMVETRLRAGDTLADIARDLGVSRKTIYNWRDIGVLPSDAFPQTPRPKADPPRSSLRGHHPMEKIWTELHVEGGFSFRAIGQSYNVSGARVHQVVNRYLKRQALLGDATLEDMDIDALEEDNEE